MMKKIISYQNKKIVYHTYGSGQSVMLVHGFGEDGNVWKNQIEFLKETFHVIVPDLPGSGKSEMNNDMSMEGMAEVLHTIIHEENIETCTVIGHSIGGYITLALAKKYWNHLDAFGLIHSTALEDSEEKISTRKKGIEFIKQYGAFEFLKTTVPNLFSSSSKMSIPGSINDFINSLKYFTPETLIAYYHAMIQRPDSTQVLLNTNTPVLFIAGKYDIAVTLDDSLKQSHLPETCFFHLLKNSGHMGMIEEPLEVNRILIEFLLDNKNQD